MLQSWSLSLQARLLLTPVQRCVHMYVFGLPYVCGVGYMEERDPKCCLELCIHTCCSAGVVTFAPQYLLLGGML